VKAFPFDPAADLIVVTAVVAGRSRPVAVRLALDTASTTTILTPAVIARLGYGEQDLLRRTIIRSALGDEPGYLLEVKRFTSLGFSIADFQVHAHALPPGHGIDGLLGLSFLRHFHIELRFFDGVIRIDRPPAPA
jgi:hypothetical protein